MSFLKQIVSSHDFSFLLSSNNSQAENLNLKILMLLR